MLRRVIYLILSLFLILIGVNLWIRHTHIKNIEIAINKLERSFADLGLTLEIQHKNFHNVFFWNVAGELENIETYATLSDCVLYFKIPQVKIASSFNNLYNIETTILLPNTLNGYIDMNDEIANKVGMEKRYDILMASLHDPLFIIRTANVFSEKRKKMTFSLNDLSVDARNKDAKIQKVIDFSNIEINLEDLTNIKTLLTADLKNMNIYLNPEIVVKNLPKDISLDDASKNISLQLEFTNENDKKYDGNFNITTRVFEFHIDGQNEKINRKNKSDLNFKIKNFKIFLNYLTTLAISAKEESKESILEMSRILQNSIDKNSRKENDYTIFKIKDEENEVLFEGQPIEIVLQEFLQRLKT